MTTTNDNGVTHIVSISKRAASRLQEAIVAFANDRANGTAWLRQIAAREALHASMSVHPAGKGRDHE